MKRKIKKILFLYLLLIFGYTQAYSQDGAKWITADTNQRNDVNTWIAFRKNFNLKSIPETAFTKIAVDSKYWLWINGELVVFEGGLKRGPNPQDTYCDEINLAPYLEEGDNQIAVLLWFFGKDGFSHNCSGQAGLYFDMDLGSNHFTSNSTWLSRVHPAYGMAPGKEPNFRLPESNIRFDATKDIPNWQTGLDLESNFKFLSSLEVGRLGDTPWNNLVARSIPFWKDFGIERIECALVLSGDEVDTLVYEFPYNLQMTPILELNANNSNSVIDIYTDNTYAAGDVNLRAQYVTKKGYQYYESLGWLNGHKLFVVCPKEVDILNVFYRQTGYDADAIGQFSCDDPFIMSFWKKALRTMYVNMRDTFFDCPERERAQWWGDVVLLMGECFYTFSDSTHDLMKKGILELVNWQRENGELFSPVPAGNYNTELPGQMLASIGEYGFWNYYMNTGDLATLKQVYPHVKKYLSIWELDETGLTKFRAGDWTWGDWGENKDMRLIFAGWHYLALNSAVKMAEEVGEMEDISFYRKQLRSIYNAYNASWNGKEYRHPEYEEQTDDRVQALAVLAGIADSSKYDSIYATLQKEFHASPYMEKYVMEALFKMGYGEYAIERMKTRYSPMVDKYDYTTLFEGWDIGSEGFGGGTVNHAWSGGPQIVIAQYICGIQPLESGYTKFLIAPNTTIFNRCSIDVPSVMGMIHSSFIKTSDGVNFKIKIPMNTSAEFKIPTEFKSQEIYINNKKHNLNNENSLILQPGNYMVEFK